MTERSRGSSVLSPILFEQGRVRGQVRVTLSEKMVAIGLCLLLLLENLLLGGARQEVALAFAAVQCLALSTALVAFEWARATVGSPRGLLPPTALFTIVLIVALWSLTPWIPGGPHPVWSYVDAPPAAALDKSAVVIELIKLCALACLFMLGWLLGAEDNRARFFLTALALVLGAFAVASFGAHVLSPTSMVNPDTGGPPGALTATFYSSNTAGTLFGVSTLLSASVLIDRVRSDGRSQPPSLASIVANAWWAIGILVFSAVCLILTASRGALAATVVASILFLGWEATSRRWKLFGSAGLGLICLGVVFAFLLSLGGTPVIEKFFHTAAAASVRQQIYLAHWRAFLASPWLGYGLGAFDDINKLIMTSASYPYLWNIHATHNVYLQWLEEAGVAGALPMFAGIGLIVGKTATGAFRRVRMTTWLRCLSACSLVFVLHGMSDYALQISSISSLWSVLLGTGFSLSVRSRN